MELNTIEKSSGAPISARTDDSALEEIAFAAGETELGTVLIARSSVGVYSIIMGSDCDRFYATRPRPSRQGVIWFLTFTVAACLHEGG
jgi:hypothetical protein